MIMAERERSMRAWGERLESQHPSREAPQFLIEQPAYDLLDGPQTVLSEDGRGMSPPVALEDVRTWSDPFHAFLRKARDVYGKHIQARAFAFHPEPDVWSVGMDVYWFKRPSVICLRWNRLRHEFEMFRAGGAPASILYGLQIYSLSGDEPWEQYAVPTIIRLHPELDVILREIYPHEVYTKHKENINAQQRELAAWRRTQKRLVSEDFR